MIKINTEEAPKAIGPYSQAIAAGDFVFTSGQIPIDPKTGKIEVSTIEEQTEQVCKNLQAVLKEAALTLEDVVKTTCYLSNMDDFKNFNGVYERYFTGKPARACFAVKALPAGALVEIEAIAVKN